MTLKERYEASKDKKPKSTFSQEYLPRWIGTTIKVFLKSGRDVTGVLEDVRQFEIKIQKGPLILKHAIEMIKRDDCPSGLID
jgi:sRNA-binding regulator protein Hfq